MISFFNQNINKFNKKIHEISYNIEKINDLSPFLDISSIEKTNISKNSDDILYRILFYEDTYLINDYSNIICPCCKNNSLNFHKLYSRNIVFTLGSYIITAKIKLIVLECSHCKKIKEQQRYHTLIPDFLFPYHSYSSGIILDTINDKINNNKIEDIINNYKISHQLLYYWISIFNKYLLACSIVLNISLITSNIISTIIKDKIKFFKLFYQQYFHPFFLNKKTCIHLAITP